MWHLQFHLEWDKLWYGSLMKSSSGLMIIKPAEENSARVSLKALQVSLIVPVACQFESRLLSRWPPSNDRQREGVHSRATRSQAGLEPQDL